MSVNRPILVILLVISYLNLHSQVLPVNRSVDWSSQLGVSGGVPCVTNVYDVSTTSPSLKGDGITDNSANLQALINNTTSYPSPCVFYFPAGNYLFSNGISMLPGRVIRGASAFQTVLTFKIGTNDAPCFKTLQLTYGTPSNVTLGANKGSTSITVANGSLFSVGSWVEIYQSNDCSGIMKSLNPSNACTISWAANAIGQIFKVSNINGNILTIDRPLRFDFYAPSGGGTLQSRTIGMIENVGFESFKIIKDDNSSSNANTSTYTFQFRNASNCWIRNIESDSTFKGHVWAEYSSNLTIRDSYFWGAYAYGGSGEGYGVMLGQHVGNCLVENNIFNHLRHAMLAKQGANGNVFSYNYGLNAYWTGSPGIPPHITLHGQYPFENLFEGNVVQRITLGDYWGPSGPGNTFLRNRITQSNFQIQDSSNYENLIGNELNGGSNIIMTYGFGSSIANSIGTELHGNNVNGILTFDTSQYGTIVANSYYLTSSPTFWGNAPWPNLGPEYTLGSDLIPAQLRFQAGQPVPAIDCNTSTTAIATLQFDSPSIQVYPNPSSGFLNIDLYGTKQIKIFDLSGKVHMNISSPANSIDISSLDKGVYILEITQQNKVFHHKLLRE